MSGFSAMIQEAKALLQTESRKGARPGCVSERQLRSISAELDKMEQARDIHIFCPHYPSMIIDSWDFSDPLAVKLMGLFEAYQKLTKH